MKTEKQTINEKEYDVLIAEEGHQLQIKAEYSNNGNVIPMGDKVVFGINHWVKGSPIEDSLEFYEEVEIPEINL